GVHPHDATRALENPNLANTLESLVTSNRDVVAAVGECGLDYDRNFSAPSDQLKAFELQCELSLRVRLPLFLHERAAHEAFVGVLEKVNAKAASAAGAASNGVPSEAPWSALRGVLHCYTGEKADELARCVGLGLHFGITGWVVDERPGRGAGLAALVPSIPLDRLMVETDAPFLVPRNVKPTPKVNTPALLPHVAKAVADLYGMDAKEFGAATTRNAKAFFGL
ncbi:DNase TatD, partial [Zopfochytrium polystomum]